jgi:hypothetical protein
MCSAGQYSYCIPVADPSNVIQFLDEYKSNNVACDAMPILSDYALYTTLAASGDGVVRYKQLHAMTDALAQLRAQHQRDHEEMCRHRNKQLYDREIIFGKFQCALNDAMVSKVSVFPMAIEVLFTQLKEMVVDPLPLLPIDGEEELSEAIQSLF